MNSANKFKIVSVTLQPHRNGDHLYDGLKILGIAPGQSLADDYTHSPSAGAVWFHGLYYSRSFHLRPEDYAAMIDSAVVTNMPDHLYYGDNVPALSDEDIAEARHRCKYPLLDTVQKHLQDAHPNYRPTFTGIEYLPPEVAANYYHPLQAPKPDESMIACFEQWIASVDYRLRKRFGMGSNDLVDYDWIYLFESDYTPREAVCAFVEDNADEFGIE